MGLPAVEEGPIYPLDWGHVGTTESNRMRAGFCQAPGQRLEGSSHEKLKKRIHSEAASSICYVL